MGLTAGEFETGYFAAGESRLPIWTGAMGMTDAIGMQGRPIQMEEEMVWEDSRLIEIKN